MKLNVVSPPCRLTAVVYTGTFGKTQDIYTPLNEFQEYFVFQNKGGKRNNEWWSWKYLVEQTRHRPAFALSSLSVVTGNQLRKSSEGVYYLTCLTVLLLLLLYAPRDS